VTRDTALTVVAPTRRALTEAEAANTQRGDTVLGPLSEAWGFLPTSAPQVALPPSHAAWDELADRLPELHRSLGLRATVDRMPALDAAPAELPDIFLHRASVLLTMIAHAYHHIDERPAALPSALAAPWDEVSRRLAKPLRSMSVLDLVVCNWRLLEGGDNAPRVVENLVPLCAPTGSREQRVSWMTLVEALAESAPLVPAAARAQEAVLRDDPGGLEAELELVVERLQHITFTTLAKIDPNPSSPSFVDPVVWGKTVVTVASAIEDGVDQGPAGTGMPLFHLMDAFLGRANRTSLLGRELVKIRTGFPTSWRTFLDAVEECSVRDYVVRVGGRSLRSAFDAALDAYAGEHGLLGRHRLKAYGYIDVGFRAGRSATLVGFAGNESTHAWNETDAELEAARQDRLAGTAAHVTLARPIGSPLPAGGPSSRTRQVLLDLGDGGRWHRPGDRLAVLPVNSAGLVERTLTALDLDGQTVVPLDSTWRRALVDRGQSAAPRTLTLRELLEGGRIRPLGHDVARALFALTHDVALAHVVERSEEARYELWDVVERLRGEGFDPKRLLAAPLGARENICRVVPPELFRLYSIGSSVGLDRSTVRLTVAPLRFETSGLDASPVAWREGTASHFLTGDRSTGAGAERGARGVAVRIVPSPRFRPPADPAVPLVMIAGGTGVAPFLSFVEQRCSHPSAGPTWLFVSARTRDEIYCSDELARAVQAGRLELHVALTREDIAVVGVCDDADGVTQLRFAPGNRRRIDELLLDERHARRLYRLLRPVDVAGPGGHVYVCGRPGFAETVMRAVRDLHHRFVPVADAERDNAAEGRIRRLVGEGRFVQEVYTSASDPTPSRELDISEVARHTDERVGCWTIISDQVYDMTRFAHLHPGGFAIIRGYVGADATEAYERVGHHLSPEVHALLDMYRVGTVRRPALSSGHAVALTQGGLTSFTIEHLYDTWVRLVQLVVETSNALENEWALQTASTVQGEPAQGTSAYKLAIAAATHARLVDGVRDLLREPAEYLWSLTAGACEAGCDTTWFGRRVRASDEALGTASERVGKSLRADLDALAVGRDDAREATIAGQTRTLVATDRAVLGRLRDALLDGVKVFEVRGVAATTENGAELMGIVRRLPGLLADYARALDSLA
jgi:sulfite reductase alpha subunit-like flavoprotein